MLSFTRTFLSPSSLSPALYYPLRFLSLFSLAFLINSAITFAEATPVPLGIPQPSQIFQFEKCTSHKTSGFLFRVGFYDPQGGKTTKSGQGVLVVCIGMNYCFGYTTTTTTAGGGGSVGTVIYTSPQRRNVIKGLSTDAYHQLSIKPDCDKFNTWSFSNGPEHNPGRTLVDFLMNIADLQSVLRDYPHNASDPVTIDSEASYILAVLDYLQSRGMLKTYDRSQIKEFLGTLKKANQIPSSSMLSWGFRNFQGKGRWILLTGVPSKDEKTTLLCFGIFYCFGLHDKSEVKYLHPVPSHRKPDERYSVWMRSPGLYPSFDLQKFEEQLRASRTSFLARLTAHSQDVISFQDFPPDEIKKETGLEKRDGEDMDTFYFRVLLGYMATKQIIGNYNTKTYGEIMKALELASSNSTQQAQAAVVAVAHDTAGTNSQGRGAANYTPRISVSSLLQNTTQNPQNPSMVIAQRCTSLLFKKLSKKTCEKSRNSESKVGRKSRVNQEIEWDIFVYRVALSVVVSWPFETPHSSSSSTSFYILLFYFLLFSLPKVQLPPHQQPEQQLDPDHPIYPRNGVTGTAGVGSGVYTVEGVYTIDRVYTVEGVHTGVAIHESGGGGGGGRTQTGSGRIGGMYCGVEVGLGRLFERRKTWGPPVAGAVGAAWATGAGAGAGVAAEAGAVPEVRSQAKDPEERNNSKTVNYRLLFCKGIALARDVVGDASPRAPSVPSWGRGTVPYKEETVPHGTRHCVLRQSAAMGAILTPTSLACLLHTDTPFQPQRDRYASKKKLLIST
ncbi:hypothetical protein EV368DRAFT_69541 [Lentinula lateritia]|nr:hypothetical protein EV368DRAFT_69541 [Lentinula lateritia]